MTTPIRFGVQAGAINDVHEWLELARKTEDAGFATLFVADHPGITPSPFVSLAAAAAVTTTIKLGTYVCNTGVREPVALASDAATVDLVSNGRLVLGLGAGHTPAEWTMEGRAYPSVRGRIARFGEMVEVVTRVLAGEVVTFTGEFLRTEEAFLLAPRPFQEHVPLLIGANSFGMLRIAARHADVVSLSGLGRTLPDGHRHTVDWSVPAIDARVAAVRSAGRAPVIDALVQHVEITDTPELVADGLASRIEGLDPADVDAAPYVWVGSVEAICQQLLAARERWGFTSYVVREHALDEVSEIVRRLA